LGKSKWLNQGNELHESKERGPLEEFDTAMVQVVAVFS
jgi:hypothetical protein